jgi:glyoxylase-like metal-dependent hydrolase (beta-lactamase superfamily II)
MRIGDLEILPVSDGTMVVAESRALPFALRSGFDAHKDYLTRDRQMIAGLGAFLVRTGDRLVLLDAGMGPRHCGPDCGHDHPYDADDIIHHQPLATAEDQAACAAIFRQRGMSDDLIAQRTKALQASGTHYGELGQNLAGLGVTPGEITDVIVSHLHCDHMGWISRRGQSYFPNADIWVHQADVDYFLNGDPPDEDLFKLWFGVEHTKSRMAPAMSQIKTWDKDCTIAPGIDVVWTPGHTPGSSISVLSSGKARGMMLGDVIHCPLELVDDEFAIVADVDPALAAKQRERMKRELEDSSIHATSTHFPGLRWGRLLSAEGHRAWDWDE